VPYIKWTEKLQLGIPVIDGQHRRIFDYINEIHALTTNDRQVIGRIVEDLVDYTYSHFAFEEALMEETGYEALAIHKETHHAFRNQVDRLRKQHAADENISAELAQLLETWLIQHIQNDDASYGPLVKQQLQSLHAKQNGNWLGKTLRRFFGNT